MMIVKYPCVKQVEGENPWITYTKQQTTTNNNCINSIWTGSVGSGKSYGLLSYFCLLDPDFELEGNWFFRASKFMRAIDRNKDNHQPGKMWGFDEAGIAFNNLDYHNEMCKGLNAFLQTGRHRNYIFGFTVPDMSFVTKGIRKLMNVRFQANGWNSDSQTLIVPHKFEYNGERDKFYKKRLIVKQTDGLTNYCNEIRLPLPPKHIRVEYEKRKGEFTDELNHQIADTLEKIENKSKEQHNPIELDHMAEEIIRLAPNNNTEQLAERFGCSQTNIWKRMATMKKKGIFFRLKNENGKGIGYEVVDTRQKPLEKPDFGGLNPS